MKGWRWWHAGMVAWLFALYNVERLHAPLNLASFVYPLAALSALAVLLVPAAARVAIPALAAGPLLVYAALKASFGLPAFGAALPLSVTEVCALVVSVMLAARIARDRAAIESSIGIALVEHLEERCAPFELGQAQMVQEMRRARRFERPLSALSLAPAEGLSEVAVDEIFARVQRENLERYIFARVGRILTDQTEGSGVITQRGDHFVALLPESTGADAEALAQRLEQEIAEGLGLRVRFGIAAFPEQEVTLDALVQRAEREMRRHEPSVSAIAAERSRSAKAGRSGGAAELAARQPAVVEPADAVADKAQGAA